MSLFAVVVLHEYGLPIYKKFKRGEERPMEPLIAAILGLAKEVGLGDVAHATFERASLIVLRGISERKLLLSLLVRRVDHNSYLWGIYLLSKLEKAIGDLPDVVTDDIVDTAKSIIDKYFDKLPKIPDFLGESFLAAAEKYGPLFYSSLMVLLYRKFGTDPLVTLVRDPPKFIREIDKILGRESVDQLGMYTFIYLCETYKDVCTILGVQDVRAMAKELLKALRKTPRREALKKFRDLIEKIIDTFLSQSSS